MKTGDCPMKATVLSMWFLCGSAVLTGCAPMLMGGLVVVADEENQRKYSKPDVDAAERAHDYHACLDAGAVYQCMRGKGYRHVDDAKFGRATQEGR